MEMLIPERIFNRNGILDFESFLAAKPAVVPTNIEPSNETTLQRVLRNVYGRTRGVSETQSLAGFLFKDQEQAVTEYTKWDKN